MTLPELFHTIATDARAASRIVKARPELASEPLVVGASRRVAASYFIDEIAHYMYGGDTALHIAAAAYRTALVRELVAWVPVRGARAQQAEILRMLAAS